MKLFKLLKLWCQGVDVGWTSRRRTNISRHVANMPRRYLCLLWTNLFHLQYIVNRKRQQPNIEFIDNRRVFVIEAMEASQSFECKWLPFSRFSSFSIAISVIVSSLHFIIKTSMQIIRNRSEDFVICKNALPMYVLSSPFY